MSKYSLISDELRFTMKLGGKTKPFTVRFFNPKKIDLSSSTLVDMRPMQQLSKEAIKELQEDSLDCLTSEKVEFGSTIIYSLESTVIPNKNYNIFFNAKTGSIQVLLIECNNLTNEQIRALWDTFHEVFSAMMED